MENGNREEAVQSTETLFRQTCAKLLNAVRNNSTKKSLFTKEEIKKGKPRPSMVERAVFKKSVISSTPMPNAKKNSIFDYDCSGFSSIDPLDKQSEDVVNKQPSVISISSTSAAAIDNNSQISNKQRSANKLEHIVTKLNGEIEKSKTFSKESIKRVDITNKNIQTSKTPEKLNISAKKVGRTPFKAVARQTQTGLSLEKNPSPTQYDLEEYFVPVKKQNALEEKTTNRKNKISSFESSRPWRAPSGLLERSKSPGSCLNMDLGSLDDLDDDDDDSFLPKPTKKTKTYEKKKKNNSKKKRKSSTKQAVDDQLENRLEKESNNNRHRDSTSSETDFLRIPKDFKSDCKNKESTKLKQKVQNKQTSPEDKSLRDRSSIKKVFGKVAYADELIKKTRKTVSSTEENGTVDPKTISRRSLEKRVSSPKKSQHIESDNVLSNEDQVDSGKVYENQSEENAPKKISQQRPREGSEVVNSKHLSKKSPQKRVYSPERKRQIIESDLLDSGKLHISSDERSKMEEVRIRKDNEKVDTSPPRKSPQKKVYSPKSKLQNIVTDTDAVYSAFISKKSPEKRNHSLKQKQQNVTRDLFNGAFHDFNEISGIEELATTKGKTSKKKAIQKRISSPRKKQNIEDNVIDNDFDVVSEEICENLQLSNTEDKRQRQKRNSQEGNEMVDPKPTSRKSSKRSYCSPEKKQQLESDDSDDESSTTQNKKPHEKSRQGDEIVSTKLTPKRTTKDRIVSSERKQQEERNFIHNEAYESEAKHENQEFSVSKNGKPEKKKLITPKPPSGKSQRKHSSLKKNQNDEFDNDNINLSRIYENPIPSTSKENPQMKKTQQRSRKVVASDSKKSSKRTSRIEKAIDTTSSIELPTSNSDSGYQSGLRRSTRNRRPVHREAVGVIYCTSERELKLVMNMQDKSVSNSSKGNSKFLKHSTISSSRKTTQNIVMISPIPEQEDVNFENQNTENDNLQNDIQNTSSTNTPPIILSKRKSNKKSVKSGKIAKTSESSKKKLVNSLRNTLENNQPDEINNYLNVCEKGEIRSIRWLYQNPKYTAVEGVPGFSTAVVNNFQGFVKIAVGRSKPKQMPLKHMMYFGVINGQAEVGVKDECAIVKPYDTFLVPKGEKYYIKNLSGNDELDLFYYKFTENPL